jgi:hypothetical protein
MDASTASWSSVIASSAVVSASTAACLLFDLVLGGASFQSISKADKRLERQSIQQYGLMLLDGCINDLAATLPKPLFKIMVC